MRRSFPEYYPPSVEELDRLWNDGVIILDANVLLHLHRYGTAVRNQFVDALRSRVERIWIPHQVAHEYQRNRLNVVHSQLDAYDDIERALKGAQELVATQFGQLKMHPVIEPEAMLQKFSGQVQEILEKVASEQSRHKRMIGGGIANDDVWHIVTELYDGRVGLPYEDARLEAIFSEGARRYEEKVPPGYLDQGKGEPDCYGDLIVWNQILDYVSDEPRPIIFVTDDVKDDWWNKVRGKVVGPRVELLREFYSRSGGMPLHFYRPAQFLTYASERSNLSLSAEAIHEVRSVSEVDEKVGKRKQLENEFAHLAAKKRTLIDTYDAVQPQRGYRAYLEQLQAEVTSRDEMLKSAESSLNEAAVAMANAIGSKSFEGAEARHGMYSALVDRRKHEYRIARERFDRAMRNAPYLGSEDAPDLRHQITRIDRRLAHLQRELSGLPAQGTLLDDQDIDPGDE